MKTIDLIVLIIFVNSLAAEQVRADQLNDFTDTVCFTVKTFDDLVLPARVMTGNADKKMILFIDGSTPYDEKGNIGAFWNDKGKIIPERHEFYLRFLDIMSCKGYSVATMAKRSYTYPTRIPRPTLTELALDIKSCIDELISRGLLKNEKDLVEALLQQKYSGSLKTSPVHVFC